MSFELRDRGDGRVEMAGRLDATAAEDAEGAFRALRGSVVLDCSGLDYISSAGLSLLIQLHQRLQAAGDSVTLVGLVPRVRNVFMYAGFDRLLKIE